jgi:hypothetical protein
MNDEMNGGYFSIVTAEVRYDERLSANAKLLYGDIKGLANRSGFCWATNGWFAERLGCSERAITGWIAELCDAGHIHAEIEDNFKRRIFVNGGWNKSSRGVEQTFQGGRTDVLCNSKSNKKEEDTTSAEIGISPSLSLTVSDEDDAPMEEDRHYVPLDSDGEEYRPRWGKKEKSAPKRDEKYKERERMLDIIEATFHKKFFNRAKQHVILKGLLDNGATTKDITSAIKKVADSDYWKERGWDLATISAEMSRK